jgi:hypothetical protein
VGVGGYGIRGWWCFLAHLINPDDPFKNKLIN